MVVRLVVQLVLRLVTGVPVRAAPAVSRAGAPPARSLIIFLSISVLLFSPACLVSASQDGVQPTTSMQYRAVSIINQICVLCHKTCREETESGISRRSLLL